MPGAAGRPRCSSARAGSAGRSRCRSRGPTGVSRRGPAGCRPRGSPRSARWRHAHCKVVDRHAWSAAYSFVMNEHTRTRSGTGLAGMPTRRLLSRRRAAGRAARRRRAGAVRLADRADAAVRQARLPVRRRRAARPVCLLRPEDRRAGAGCGTSRRPWPGWCAGTCATARRSRRLLAEISAINAELLARQRTVRSR